MPAPQGNKSSNEKMIDKPHIQRRLGRIKDALGMPLSKAQAILRREILFLLVKQCGRDRCFRCEQTIGFRYKNNFLHYV